MPTKTQHIVLTALLAAATTCVNAQTTEVDTSGWECQYCVYPEGFTGSYWLGVGSVSDDAFSFENYTGLEEGEFAILGIDGLRINNESFWRIKADELYHDSRELSIDGGRPGSWRLNASWRELPQRINDSGISPFVGVGSDTLNLPDSWINAPNTGDMESLAQSLRPVGLESDRETFALGLRFTPPGDFEYAVNYQRQMKEGVQAAGGGFMFTSSILPAPIDYVTDQIDASVSFHAGDWTAEVSYYGSFFENDDRGLLFDSPFNPLVPGAEQGRFSLAPDNEFHRIGLTGHYRFSDSTRLTGSLGFGRMTQDDSFLPFTENTTNVNVNPGPLPRNSLDGEVDIVDFKAKLVTRLSSHSRVKAEYRYYDRDNSSPQDDYNFVTQDLFVNLPRRNLPFSYQRQQLNLEGSYRFNRARLAAGLGYETYDRTVDEPADTSESMAWVRANMPLEDNIDVSMEISYSERDGDNFNPASALAEIENPALRKFNYADRDRSRLKASVILSPNDVLQLGWHVSIASDDYTESLVGLTDSDQFDSTLDLTIAPSAAWSGHLYASWEDMDSSMSGSSTASAADWFGNTNDLTKTGGIGFGWHDLGEIGASLSMDYVYAKSVGEYDIDDSSQPANFPDLVTRLKGARIRITWPLKQGAEILFDVYHESLDSEDWYIDGITPDTLFNFLALGEQSLDHSVSTFGVWYRSSF